MNDDFRRPRRWRLFAVVFVLIVAAILAVLAIIEYKTFYFEALYLSKFAKNLSFSLRPGANDSLRFPQDGPYDKRLGYTRLPDFLKNLRAQGYWIEAQARPSAKLDEMISRELYPSFREKNQAGLTIFSSDGRNIFKTQYPERIYSNFESIPSLIVNTLLFIENQELLDDRHPERNPAVEWDRLAKSVIDRGINIFNPDHRFGGGSTLATQLEKFRHSPDGQTSSAREKLRQMYSASLRAYLYGRDTTSARRQLVIDYLNSVPLAAIPGYGEVNGIGDGLWAVYGADFNAVNKMLCDGCRSDEVERARAYKQILSLFIAQRRPSYYLSQNRKALELLTNDYLHMLGRAQVITPAMRDRALAVKLEGRKSSLELLPVSFVGRKAANAIRRQLSVMLGVPQLYELDRLDVSVQSTLNGATQEEVTQLLGQLKDPDFVEGSGLLRSRLLDSGDPDRVIYSFTLYERVGNTNLLRIQTDNYEQPFDINEGVKIELGSTAKLRTLVTYLEIIAELHQRYTGLPPEKLREIPLNEADHLTRWTLEYLATRKDRSLSAMLEAAMERRYSASPGETFFTGGGEHVFHNFEKSDDSKIFSVREGFQKSVNLVFIRLMRDIVRYYMFNVPGSTAKILADKSNPARQEYLARFADQEGQIFLSRFYKKYQGKQTEEQWEMLTQSMNQTPARLAAAFRFVQPAARLAEFSVFMNTRLPSHNFSAPELERLYEAYGPDQWDLQDRGYIIGIHPLELWLVAYLREHPGAERAEIVRKSANERQEVYRWLFNTQSKNSQDVRIKSLLEVEAFLEIHRMWKKLGYPFDSLVPSYATAIGSSADRPASLAELVGIILNHGVQYPMARIEKIHFASQTPYETILRRKEVDGQKVLLPEIAAVVCGALADVVERGTAQQIRGTFTRGDGTSIAVGGKTGTGDNRYDVYGQKQQLIESRVINRAAVFVFFIGDRFFGTMTAYVPGSQAADYDFTSSLPVQILKMMAPSLMSLIDHQPPIPRTPLSKHPPDHI